MTAKIECREDLRDATGARFMACPHAATGTTIWRAEGEMFEHLVQVHGYPREDAGLGASGWGDQEAQRRYPQAALVEALAEADVNLDEHTAVQVIDFLRAAGLTIEVASSALPRIKRAI